MANYGKVQLTNNLLLTVISSGIVMDADLLKAVFDEKGHSFKREIITGILGRLTPEFFTRVSLGKFTITEDKIKLLKDKPLKEPGVTEIDLFKVIAPGKSFSIESAMDKLSSYDCDSSQRKVMALVLRMLKSGKLSKSATGRYRRLDLAPVGKCSANNEFTQLIKRM